MFLSMIAFLKLRCYLSNVVTLSVFFIMNNIFYIFKTALYLAFSYALGA